MAGKAGTKRETGRPSLYTDDMAEEICRRIANGETLTAICREPDKPHRVTVMRWMLDHEAFRSDYARARREAPHAWADEIVDKARGARPETAQAVRVQIDALKWIASRLLPRIYGERVTIEQGDGRTASELTDDELAAIASRGSRGTAATESGAG